MENKSFTLIELLVAVAIFTIMATSLYLVYEKGRSLNETIEIEADLLAMGRKAIQQLIIDLAETNRNTLTKDAGSQPPAFLDPVNNQIHQILIFASARGDPAISSEDGTHSNNNYVHLDATNRLAWRSAVIYCTYPASSGTQQLSRYIDYGSFTAYYGQTGIFPQ